MLFHGWINGLEMLYLDSKAAMLSLTSLIVRLALVDEYLIHYQIHISSFFLFILLLKQFLLGHRQIAEYRNAATLALDPLDFM